MNVYAASLLNVCFQHANLSSVARIGQFGSPGSPTHYSRPRYDAIAHVGISSSNLEGY